jgi:hypothetical protein
LGSIFFTNSLLNFCVQIHRTNSGTSVRFGATQHSHTSTPASHSTLTLHPSTTTLSPIAPASVTSTYHSLLRTPISPSSVCTYTTVRTHYTPEHDTSNQPGITIRPAPTNSPHCTSFVLGPPPTLPPKMKERLGANSQQDPDVSFNKELAAAFHRRGMLGRPDLHGVRPVVVPHEVRINKFIFFSLDTPALYCCFHSSVGA